MKVAKIIDEYAVAVTTRGQNLNPGDILSVVTDPVIDPENGEIIGVLETLRVKVTDVYEKFVIAETYELRVNNNPKHTVDINIGDEVYLYETKGMAG